MTGLNGRNIFICLVNVPIQAFSSLWPQNGSNDAIGVQIVVDFLQIQIACGNTRSLPISNGIGGSQSDVYAKKSNLIANHSKYSFSYLVIRSSHGLSNYAIIMNKYLLFDFSISFKHKTNNAQLIRRVVSNTEFSRVFVPFDI